MDEKSKIIDHANKVFLQNGFYKITMDELAKGLGMSKKTLYKHFPSKNILIDTVVNGFQKGVRNNLLKRINEQNNAILKIRVITEIFAELSLRISQNMLYDLQTHRPELWTKVENFRTKLIFNIWEEIIGQGKKEGYIVNKPNDIIITVVISSIQSVVNPTFLLNHNYSMNNAFKITFDLLIKGILTKKGLKVYNQIEQDSKDEKN